MALRLTRGWTRAGELPVALPHPALPAADWADCFYSDGPGGLTAREAMTRMSSGTPPWVRQLTAIRNALAVIVGLKGGKASAGFPIHSERPDELIVGMDDKHLEFCLIVRVDDLPVGGQRISMTTLVKRHNRFGRAYLAVIAPFHRAIARRSLANLNLDGPRS